MSAQSSLHRGWLRPALVISVGIHLLLALAAGFWVVSRYQSSRKLTFNAGPKSPNSSERAIEHRVQLQKKLSAPPALPQRIVANAPAKIVLPEMPALPQATESMLMPMSGAAMAPGGFGAPSMPGFAPGGTGPSRPITFFGIRDVSTSVVIMIDVSDSMFGRTGDLDYKTRKLVRHGTEQIFQAIRDEAIKLVQSLTSQTRFGIIRWAGSARSWKPELVQATDSNKAAAIAHIQNEIDYHSARKTKDRPGGTRHDYALEEVFKLKPETIFMLTDGQASGTLPNGQKLGADDLYRIIDEGQRTLRKKVRLHTIYYVTGKDKAGERQLLSNLAARSGGQFRQVNAKK